MGFFAIQRRKKHILFLSLSFLVLGIFVGGCGSTFEKMEDGMTTVTVSGPRRNLNMMENFSSPENFWGTAAPLNGGGVIYAARVGQPNAIGRRIFGSGGELVWTLPNGAYYFYALGFEEPLPTGFSPRLHCGVADGDSAGAVNLNGVSRNIEMALQSSIVGGGACDNPPFNPGASVSAIALTAPGISSFRFAIFFGDDFDGRGESEPRFTPMSTACFSVLPSISLGSTGLPGKLPFGVGGVPERPIKFEILTYSDLGCVTPLYRYTFPLGIGSANGVLSRAVFRDGVEGVSFATYGSGSLQLN